MSTFNKSIKSLMLAAACCGLIWVSNAQEGNPSLGRVVSEADLQSMDQIIEPDGTGLPSGGGDARAGEAVYQARCAACHGAEGEGQRGVAALVGGSMDSAGPPLRTVGSYWPYSSTLFDFIRRAMPADSPKSLSDDEVYQVTAYVLYMNGIIAQNASLNAETLAEVKMPNSDGFSDQSQVR